MADDTDSEENGDMNLFKEPEDYYAPEKQHTIATHTTLTGQTLDLQLVGHNPLWVSIDQYNFVRTVTGRCSRGSLNGRTRKIMIADAVSCLLGKPISWPFEMLHEEFLC